MSFLSIFMIAIGLAMDSFAVSITSGVILSQFRLSHAFRIAFYMGVFQSLMPLIGWLLGIGFNEMIKNYDHWIAMLILTVLGLKMIYEGINDDETQSFDPLNRLVLIGLAVATSIDAMAVGLSFAFLQVAVTLPFVMIGVVTSLISGLGVFLGAKFKHKISFPVEIIGGVILVIIGLKILIEHTLLN